MAEFDVVRLGETFTVLVDEEDVELVQRYRWHLGKNGYVFRNLPMVNYVRGGAEYLHRELLGLQKGEQRDVDHINHNKLDNRRCNLRIGSHQENMQNMLAHRDAHLPHRDISRSPRGRYIVHVRRYGVERSRHLRTLEEALVQADAWRALTRSEWLAIPARRRGGGQVWQTSTL